MRALLLLPLLPLLALANEGEKSFKPYVVLTGAQSAVKERAFFLVRSAEDWAALWLKHLGRPAQEDGYNWHYNEDHVPEVDFGQCMVLAIFQGSAWNSAGLTAVSAVETKDRITFRYDDKSYQTLGPDGGGERVAAWGFFVLPRSSKTLVVEENVQGLIGGDPDWKERARFETG